MIKATPRLWAIWKVTRRYGLSEFWGGKPANDPRPRGERLRLALQELGPVFIKFGQALSTRPDILPPDVASELAQLQDKVEPFSGREARELVERSLGKPIDELFLDFDETPLAAASVAQVHTARLKPQDEGDPGFEVVLKVLRPGVHARVEKDVALLRALAEFAERWHPLGKRLRPREVVAEYERVIFDELDLMREGANCSLLRRNWLGSELIYHPIVFWDYTRADVLVMERIHGVSLRELDKLREMGVNFQVLAERGVEIFFKQVFRDNFFHADMHPGNIFVDVSDVRKPSYLAVDFGIVGQLGPADLRYLAENFLAFFNRDYRRIAELHLESGWIPADVRAEDFESAIRTVSEPIFGKPIKDISFPKQPRFYGMQTFDGVPYWKIATLHGADVLATTVLQTCVRYGRRSTSCQFCAIGESLKGERTINRKTPEQLGEVARAAMLLDGIQHMVMTTGTPNFTDRGAEILCESAFGVKAATIAHAGFASGLPIQGQCEPPDDPRWYQRMKNAGIDTLGMHIEAVSQSVREQIMPGKATVTVDHYLTAFEQAVAVFGRGQVSTYILYGLGDTREAVLAMSERLIALGVYPFVVPFVPIAGTPLENQRSPDAAEMRELLAPLGKMLVSGGLKSAEIKAGCGKCGACSSLSAYEQV